MIRIAKECDLDDIIKIERDCFARPYSGELILQDLRGDKVKTFVYAENETIVGFISVYVFLDEANLQQIAVESKHRNKGIASALLQYVINYLKHQPVVKFYLEVNENNLIAIKTYEKFGFKKVVTRKNYYGNQNALVYELML